MTAFVVITIYDGTILSTRNKNHWRNVGDRQTVRESEKTVNALYKHIQINDKQSIGQVIQQNRILADKYIVAVGKTVDLDILRVKFDIISTLSGSHDYTIKIVLKRNKIQENLVPIHQG